MAPLPGDVLDVQTLSPKQLADFEAGRDIYLRDCSSCHAIEPINRYSLREWSRIIPGMAEESNLTEEETRLLSDYIYTIRQAMKPSNR